MRCLALTPAAFAIFVACTASCPTRADSFGSGLNAFEIEFVSVGHPGNAADTASAAQPPAAGSVGYPFRMGKYEISEQMINKANALGGLEVTIDVRGPNKPATSVSWFEAARFVNWLNESTGHAPAYKFESGAFAIWQPGDAGFNENNPFRNRRAKYVLPTAHEWYKAAYYNPATATYNLYPTGPGFFPDGVDVAGDQTFDAVFNQSGGLAFETQPYDVTNAGVLSSYGTMAQGGNALEWEESPGDDRISIFTPSASRGQRGGYWDSSEFFLSKNNRRGESPDDRGTAYGFRVASVPEPSGFSAAAIIAVAAMSRRRKRC